MGEVTMIRANIDAIRRALVAAGIAFIPENGGGEGVRRRKGASPPTEQVYRSVGLESDIHGGPEAPEWLEIETDD
jgi:hypothetical protein